MGMNHLQFEQRVSNIGRKNRALARGYSTRVRPDGLIVARPRRRQVGLSLKSVILFVLAIFAFKGFLIADIGVKTYDERVDRLKTGTIVEQAGAWVMQIDPLSAGIAQQIGPILR